MPKRGHMHADVPQYTPTQVTIDPPDIGLTEFIQFVLSQIAEKNGISTRYQRETAMHHYSEFESSGLEICISTDGSEETYFYAWFITEDARYGVKRFASPALNSEELTILAAQLASIYFALHAFSDYRGIVSLHIEEVSAFSHLVAAFEGNTDHPNPAISAMLKDLHRWFTQQSTRENSQRLSFLLILDDLENPKMKLAKKAFEIVLGIQNANPSLDYIMDEVGAPLERALRLAPARRTNDSTWTL